MAGTTVRFHGKISGFRMFLAVLLVASFTSRAWAMEPADIYRQKSPGVVLIFAKLDEKTRKGGTGFFVNNQGMVVTNAHVITDNNNNPIKEISVYLKPEKVTGDFQRDLQDRHSAQVVKFDRALDVALLQVDSVPASVPPLSFADSENVEVGQKVVAIGHPEQGGLWTLTSGAISARIKNLSRVEGKDMFQSDANINHGNSGGPLLDINGQLVGMNTSTARTSSDGSAIVGINFALQSNVIIKWLNLNNLKAAATPPAASAAPRREVAEVVQSAPPANASKTANQPPAAPPEILTPKKPFEWNNLEETIAEMEDLMKEMHGKVKKKFGK